MPDILRILSLLVLALLLLAQFLQAADVGFLQEPDDALVSLTRPIAFQLHCLVKGRPTVHWEFLSQAEPRSVDSLPWIKSLPNNTLIVLANISTPGVYLGRYQCLAEYEHYGTVGSRFAEVETYSNVFFNLTGPENHTIAVGNTVTLRCRLAVHGRHKRNKQISPHVIWTHNGFRLEVITMPGAFIAPSGDLQLARVSLASSGLYTCSGVIGTEGRTLTSAPAYLTVETRSDPSTVTVSPGPTEVVVIQGRPAFLQCSMAGFPVPTVNWLPTRPSAQVIGSNLYFERTRISDTGSYICYSITRQKERVEQKFSLIVLEPLHLDMSPFKIDLLPSQTASVRCGVSRENRSSTDAATVSFEWHFGSDVLDVTEIGREYSIARVTGRQIGILQCRGVRQSTGEEATVTKVVSSKPPVPKELAASEITERRAVIRWKLDTDTPAPVPFNISLIWFELPQNNLEHKMHVTKEEIVQFDDRTRSHKLMKLKPKTKYQVVVLAVNSLGVRSQSERVETFTTLMAISSHPRNVTIDVLSDVSVRIQWEPPSKGSEMVADYLIWREDLDTNVRDVVPVPAVQRNIIIRSLQPYTDYAFVVYARNRDAELSAGSRKHYAKTFWTSLAVSPVNSTSVLLDWTLPASFVNVEVHLAVHQADNCINPAVGNKTVLPVNATTYIASGLIPTRTYCFFISPFTTSGGYLNWVKSSDVLIPTYTPNLTVTVASDTTVRISWDLPLNHSKMFAKYLVWYKEVNSDIRKNATVPAGQHDTIIKALKPNTEYSFVVHALPAGGEWTTHSRKHLIRTMWASSFSAKAINSTTVTLNWTLPSNLLDAETHIVIHKSGQQVNLAKSDQIVLPANTTVYTASGLTPSQSYNIFISPVTADGHLVWLNSGPIIMPPLAPDVKSISTTILVKSNSIELNWLVEKAHDDAGKLVSTEYKIVALASNDTLTGQWTHRTGTRLHFSVVLKLTKFIPEAKYEVAVRSVTTLSGVGRTVTYRFSMPPIVQDVSNFVARAHSTESVQLSWTPTRKLFLRNPTHYSVVKKLRHGKWNHVEEVKGTGGEETLIISGLLEGGEYTFKVVAHWKDAISEATQHIIMPLEGSFPRPQHVLVRRLHNKSIELHWQHVPPRKDSEYKRFRFEIHYTMAGTHWPEQPVFMVTSMPSSSLAVSHHFIVDQAVKTTSPVKLRVRTVYLRNGRVNVKSNFSRAAVAIRQHCCRLPQSTGLHHPIHVQTWYTRVNTSGQLTVRWHAPHIGSDLITHYVVFYWRFPRSSAPQPIPTGQERLPANERLLVLQRNWEENVVYAVRVAAVRNSSSSASHTAFAYVATSMQPRQSDLPSPSTRDSGGDNSTMMLTIIIAVCALLTIVIIALAVAYNKRRSKDKANQPVEKSQGHRKLEKRQSQTKPVLWAENKSSDEPDTKTANNDKTVVSHYATVVCTPMGASGSSVGGSPPSASTNTLRLNDAQPYIVEQSRQVQGPGEEVHGVAATQQHEPDNSIPSPAPVGHTLNDYDEPIPVVRPQDTSVSNVLAVPPNNYTRTGRSATPPPSPPPPGYSSLDTIDRPGRPTIQRSKSAPTRPTHKLLEPHIYAEPDTGRKRSRSGLNYAKLDMAMLGPCSEEPVNVTDKVIYAEVKLPMKSGRLEMDA